MKTHSAEATVWGRSELRVFKERYLSVTHVMDRPSAFRTYRLSVAAAPSWCVALVVLLSFASARADTFHVDVKWEGASKGTPEAPFHTLGEGAKAFRSGNGHVIKVAAGL